MRSGRPLLFLVVGLAGACSSSKLQGGADAGDDAGGGSCTFSSTYTIFDSPSPFASQYDVLTLAPPTTFHYERTLAGSDAGALSCEPAIPSCQSAGAIDMFDVEAAIASPDVQAALAQPARSFYGESTAGDAGSFQFTRGDGRGFTDGYECTTASVTCTPTPAGVQALVQLLRAFIAQQLADPTCAGFH